MKKLTIMIATFLLVGVTVFAQAQWDLSAAIDKSAKEISSQLPSKSRVAVISFFSDSKELSNYISQEMVKKLTQQATLTVLERNERNMSLIDAEQDYQYSGSVSDDSMVEIGAKKGAEYIVYGAFDQFGGMMSLTIQVTDVETAEIKYMTPYNITKTTQITDLLGDEVKLDRAGDYLEAIARCQRKVSSIEREKSKNIQNTNTKINAKYQEEINQIMAQEKDPWESTKEYNERIDKAVNEVVKKRDTELDGVEKSASIKYNDQLKQVEIQKNKLIQDMQSTTFTLGKDSVQVLFGAFDAEAKRKNWNVSIKSLDNLVSYSWTGPHYVNDADVKTEYKMIEAAKAANDLEGEINYRIIEGSSKEPFDIYIVSVKVIIQSTSSTIVNESINEVHGHPDVNRIMSGKSSTKATTTSTIETTKPVAEKKTQIPTKTSNVKTDIGKETKSIKTFSDEDLFIKKNWHIDKENGSGNIKNESFYYQDKVFNMLSINAKRGRSSWFNITCDTKNSFFRQGNTIKFKCIGDGKDWDFEVTLYSLYPNETVYKYVFSTEKGKITEIEIPYSKMEYYPEMSHIKRDFDNQKIINVSFNPPFGEESNIKIFDMEIY